MVDRSGGRGTTGGGVSGGRRLRWTTWTGEDAGRTRVGGGVKGRGKVDEEVRRGDDGEITSSGGRSGGSVAEGLRRRLAKYWSEDRPFLVGARCCCCLAFFDAFGTPALGVWDLATAAVSLWGCMWT
ncbi:hypothetical protein H310_13659 [Aphanomyces invadans]|uniref:Uncharacterized protein n=1 Tax=Aphanomyces invadans TaxID=157072 RepID=A0A024TCF7_9STRA|nr:hypothetical protein H310_13659 [Aphanomyces invadans]ETV91830.1 hypothetical protein H310_13659 [Aphanomyces invadans]|eukprot:XP_008879467.1 hypothetical protein H310_13659 [Aphanomyces invadans]